MAVALISVVWTVALFGAALGDMLPGESSGDDINDDLADLGELVESEMDFVIRTIANKSTDSPWSYAKCTCIMHK